MSEQENLFFTNFISCVVRFIGKLRNSSLKDIKRDWLFFFLPKNYEAPALTSTVKNQEQTFYPLVFTKAHGETFELSGYEKLKFACLDLNGNVFGIKDCWCFPTRKKIGIFRHKKKLRLESMVRIRPTLSHSEKASIQHDCNHTHDHSSTRNWNWHA